MVLSNRSPPFYTLNFLELCQEAVWDNLFNLYLILWLSWDTWGLDFLSSQWANDCSGFFSFPIKLKKKRKKKEKRKKIKLTEVLMTIFTDSVELLSPHLPPREKKRKIGDTVLGMGIQIDLRKFSSHPRGLGMWRGHLCPQYKGRKREWQGLGLGRQPGNSGLLLWWVLKVQNEGTHMFHWNWRKKQFCCQLTQCRNTVKGIFRQKPWCWLQLHS